jgi:hypothetical protein
MAEAPEAHPRYLELRRLADDAPIADFIAAMQAVELASDEDVRAVSDEVFRLADRLWDAGGSEAAEPVLLAFAEATFDGYARTGSARWVLSLAWRLRQWDLLQHSLWVLETAVGLETPPPEDGAPPPAAEILVELGECAMDLGDLNQTHAACTAALELLEPGLDAHDHLRFRALNHVAAALIERGDLLPAKALIQESLEVGGRLGLSPHSLAIRIDNLGHVEVLLAERAGPLWFGDDMVNEPTSAHLRRAEHQFQRAQALFEQSLPASRADLAVSLIHSAGLAQQWRHVDEMDALSERAAALATPDSTPFVLRWHVLTFRGGVLHSLGRSGEAVALLAPLLEELPGTVLTDQIPGGLVALLRSADAVGDRELVDFVAGTIASSDDQLLGLRLAQASEAQARYMFDDYAYRTRIILGCCLPSDPAGEAPPWLYDLLLNRKGILAERQGSAWLAARRAEGAPADLLAEVRRLRAEIARLDLAGAHGESIRSARQRYTDAERELSSAEAELLFALGTAAVPAVTTADVRASLGPDTALLDLTRAERPDGSEHYILFDVRADGPVRYREVGRTGATDRKLDELVDSLKRPGQPLPPLPRLFDPGDSLPPRLIVSPAGSWGLAPFNLLPGPAGRPLIDDHVLTLIPSARRLAAPASHAPDAPGAALVIGGPAFDLGLPDDLPFLLSMRYAPLPYALAEVHETAALLGVPPVTGADATRQRLLAADSPAILHVASHGVFLTAVGSIAELSEPRTSTMRSVAGAIVSTDDNPLGWAPRGGWPAQDDDRARHRGRVAWLREIGPTGPSSRSGLLLAGFNAWLAGVATSEEIGTGMVSAGEFALLDLSGTELVVLSACETGVGAVDYTDGSLLGLRTAALAAGASCCVATLWTVGDETTTGLMSTFYRAMAAGAGCGAALRTAQLALRETHPDPHHWACWVADGDATHVPRLTRAADR